MFDPKKFTIPRPRPLPVYLLLDVSTSMGQVIDPENVRPTGKTFFKDGQEWEIVEGGITKMDQLNEAVQKMLGSFAELDKTETEIRASIITFGDDAHMHLSPTKASRIEWENLEADGETALGAALIMAKNMVEDKETTPSRAYRPTIVLVSDGQPNDSWERPMEDFIHQGRSSKCDRMALAIGEDADEEVLKQFVDGTGHELFYAENAAEIYEFFQFVTMTTVERSRSKNPNEVPAASDISFNSSIVQSESQGKGSVQTAVTHDDEGYW